MPVVAEVLRPRAVELTEWATATEVVLQVGGDLDAMACRAVEQHVRRLLLAWPGLLLGLDFEGVTRVDESAVEGLLLGIVSLRAGEARLRFSGKGGGCARMLARLGLASESALPIVARWSRETSGMSITWMSGATA